MLAAFSMAQISWRSFSNYVGSANVWGAKYAMTSMGAFCTWSVLIDSTTDSAYIYIPIEDKFDHASLLFNAQSDSLDSIYVKIAYGFSSDVAISPAIYRSIQDSMLAWYKEYRTMDIKFPRRFAPNRYLVIEIRASDCGDSAYSSHDSTEAQIWFRVAMSKEN